MKTLSLSCKTSGLIRHGITYLLLLAASLCAVSTQAQEQVTTLSGVALKRDTAVIWQSLRKADDLRFTAPDSCEMVYKHALNLCMSENYDLGTAHSFIGLATLSIDKGKFPAGLDMLRKAMPYCKTADKKGHYLMYVYKNMAAIYVQENMLDTAVYYYFEALKVFEQHKSADSALLLSIYSNLGGTFINNGQFDIALQYLQKADNVAMKTKDERQLGEIYNNIGAVYADKHSYDTAIMYSKRALAYGKKFKNAYITAFACYSTGSCYAAINQPEVAIGYYDEGLASGEKLPTLIELYLNTGLAEAYQALKKYKMAEAAYLKVLSISQASNYGANLIQVYNDLAALYSDTKDYKSALNYKTLSAALKDSTLNAEKIQATSQMEVKYRMSEKDKELVQKQLLLTKEDLIIKQKNTLFESILGGAVLLGLLSIAIYVGQQRKWKLQEVRMDGMQKEREIAQLKAKLEGEEIERTRIARELHDGIMVEFSFVKMNLSSLLDRETDDTDKTRLNKIVEQLDHATGELRKSAHNLMPDILLEEGLAEAAHYFLTGLRQSSGIEIEFQQYGNIPDIATEYELMLYRMIQELAQNAVKHSRASLVLVQLNYRENMLSLTVEDNGIGIKNSAQGGDGMGIRSIQSRVLSLKGNMEISSKEGIGTTIYIEFDIHSLQKIT